MDNENRAKRVLFWAGALALIAVAYSVFVLAGAFSNSLAASSSRSFTVVGEGKVTAKNDIAQFTYSVTIQGGKDIAKIKAESDSKTANILAYLKSQGVEAKDIKTVNYSLEPRYQYFACPAIQSASVPCRPSEIAGYTITQTDSVKIRNLTKVGTIVSGVLDKGANDVSQLTFTVDDQVALRDQARALAIAQAKVQAKNLAKAGAFQVGKILSINENQGPDYYLNREMAPKTVMMDAGAGSVASVSAGSNDIVSTLVVRFEIK